MANFLISITKNKVGGEEQWPTLQNKKTEILMMTMMMIVVIRRRRIGKQQICFILKPVHYMYVHMYNVVHIAYASQ